MCINLLKTAIFVLAIGAMACGASARGLDTLWTRPYGWRGEDQGLSICQTPDGGYAFTGVALPYGDENWQVYLIKTDAGGNVLWTQAYGGPDPDGARSIDLTSDGGFIIAGSTVSYGIGSDAYLVRTDADGDTIWTRWYGGSGDEKAYSVQQTSDGGFIFAGRTFSFGAGECDFYLVKIDAGGDTIWTKTYGGPGRDRAWSVIQTLDGGYAIAGETGSFGAGHLDVYLVKTDMYGDTLWTRTYGGIPNDQAYSIQQTSDGGYIVAGETTSFGEGWWDFYVLKTDANGDTLWARTYGGPVEDAAYSVRQTPDGGYIIAGYTGSWALRDTDFYLIRTDSSGDTLWTRTYGGPSYEYATTVEQTFPDDGFVILGHTQSFGAGYIDAWVVKTEGPLPVVTQVADVPDDQGKQVTVSWHRSGYDVSGETDSITGYSLWRRAPEASEALSGPANLSSPPGNWQYLLTVPAQGNRDYTCVAPTVCDSTSHGTCWSTFFLRALTSDSLEYFDSQPDSGYSADNLAPAPPPNLRLATPTQLAWDEPGDDDVSFFTAYGSWGPDFDSTVTLIGCTVVTDLDVSADPYVYYHVTATDSAGNEGDASSVENPPMGLSNGGENPPSAYCLTQEGPNPSEGQTTMRFDIPVPGPVSLKIFDIAGRVIAVLADGMCPAGCHSLVWTGEDESGGSVSPGIYFVRMEAMSFTCTRKVILLQ
jgi:hypothetical protein